MALVCNAHNPLLHTVISVQVVVDRIVQTITFCGAVHLWKTFQVVFTLCQKGRRIIPVYHRPCQYDVCLVHALTEDGLSS